MNQVHINPKYYIRVNYNHAVYLCENARMPLTTRTQSAINMRILL